MSLSAFWSALLQRALGALDAAGVSTVVLKGLPLAQRLYGEISARPCADLDLFISGSERRVAHEALIEAGWQWRVGIAPREAAYVIVHDGRSALLEVHSSLLDDGHVAHLPFAAPRALAVRLGDHTVPAHDDDQLAAFLATHLAKHSMPPLLWYIDFAELWRTLDEPGRRRARAAARKARAHRYIAWAIRRSEQLHDAAEGSEPALRALGFRQGGRVDVHNAARVAALAAGPGDALRVLCAWLAPRDVRSNLWQLGTLWIQRLAKSWRRALRTSHAYASGGDDSPARVGEQIRALKVGSDDFDALARGLTARGVSFWIRATGSSMEPAIATGALVRLSPLSARSIKAGDVVLADIGEGSFVLHRVRRTGRNCIHLQGDSNLRTDIPVSRCNVVAVADALCLRGTIRKIPAARFARTLGEVRALLTRFGRPRKRTDRVTALPRGQMKPYVDC